VLSGVTSSARRRTSYLDPDRDRPLSPGEDRATLRALETATRNQDRVIAVENIVSVGFDLASFSAIMVLMVTGLGVIASMMGVFNFAHGEFLLLGAF
jgi:hypothetical protein